MTSVFVLQSMSHFGEIPQSIYKEVTYLIINLDFWKYLPNK